MDRKVLHKYYPPDFDYAKLPKVKRLKKNEEGIGVRIMLPFTIQCECENYLCKGAKIHAHKSIIEEEPRVFRFKFKCKSCSADISIQTDPHRGCYVRENLHA